MNKEQVLQSISQEIISRSILSKEDIESIVSTRIDMLLEYASKDKLDNLLQDKIDLTKLKNKTMCRKTLSTITKKQQELNLKIKRARYFEEDNDLKKKVKALKEFVIENNGIDTYINVMESINN